MRFSTSTCAKTRTGEPRGWIGPRCHRPATAAIALLVAAIAGATARAGAGASETLDKATRRRLGEEERLAVESGDRRADDDSVHVRSVPKATRQGAVPRAVDTAAPAPDDEGDDDTDVATDPALPPFQLAVEASASRFLHVYIPYVQTVDDALESREKRLASETYNTLSHLSATIARAHRDAFRAAMRAATEHIQDFHSQLGPKVDPAKTSLRIDKSRFLVFLMDAQGQQAYAAFPIAIGVRSDQGPKEHPGDLRSPESPPDERTVADTPFFAHPLVPDDPYPDEGCITRGIGVSSRDARFAYLQGWTVMLHGTPDPTCIGRRASHGCIRLLPEHITVLYDYLRDGEPIVIYP